MASQEILLRDYRLLFNLIWPPISNTSSRRRRWRCSLARSARQLKQRQRQQQQSRLIDGCLMRARPTRGTRLELPI